MVQGIFYTHIRELRFSQATCPLESIHQAALNGPVILVSLVHWLRNPYMFMLM